MQLTRSVSDEIIGLYYSGRPHQFIGVTNNSGVPRKISKWGPWASFPTSYLKTACFWPNLVGSEAVSRQTQITLNEDLF